MVLMVKSLAKSIISVKQEPEPGRGHGREVNLGTHCEFTMLTRCV